ncbi:MAG TPA: rod shape-determining protein MreC [Candidatus Onthocola gallistercoris]|uniref:Cell shape-determining protein MreC n=1 Tax=Candidatus Onthocola gallistercoris TaxID=2840876 RepID=A0A9D1KW66_9FIRM|nr:rod shape-determining protein MreC [Candidatus Onthocola gallistercoris]
MNRNKRKPIKSRYLLILLVIVCAVFIGLSYVNGGAKLGIQSGITSLLVPMEKGLNSLGQWTEKNRERMKTVDELISENEALNTQIERLEAQISSMENNLSELDELRDLLDMKEIYPDYPMVGARIISKDAGNWYNNFIIDKGSNDGIKVDMNVIADNGLVGIVTDVSANHSTVRAIIDDTSSVSGMISKSSELCIINGDLQLMENGLLDVELISGDTEVVDGDEVVTSYISDKFLPGLLIGYITDVTSDSSQLTQSAHLTPEVNFENITNVMVITQLKSDLISDESTSESETQTTGDTESAPSSEETQTEGES